MIWIGTVNGLSRWDGKRFERFTTANGLVNNRVHSICEDKAGTLWFASVNSGISLWDGRRFVRVTEPSALIGQGINTLFPAAEGGAWLGFSFGGAARLEGTNVVARYDPGSGLAASYVISIARDADDVMWFGHRRDISLLNGGVWSSLSLATGLEEREDIYSNDILAAADGAMWVATEFGAYRLQKPQSLTRRPVLQVKAGTEFTGPKDAPQLNTGSRITFNFAQADRHTPSEKQQFRYQMVSDVPTAEQLEHRSHWSAPTKETQVDFATNAPGRYTFAVQYIDQHLHYSKAALATFTLVLPWYRNAAFVAPGGFGVFALVVWAFVARALYARKRHEAELLRDRLLAEEHKAREAAEAAARSEERRVGKE